MRLNGSIPKIAAAATAVAIAVCGWTGSLVPALGVLDTGVSAASAPRATITLASCECEPSEGGVGQGWCRDCDGFGDTAKQPGGRPDGTCDTCTGSGTCQKCLDDDWQNQIDQTRLREQQRGPFGGPAGAAAEGEAGLLE